MIHWDFNIINNCVFCTCWLLRLMTNILGFPALSTSPSYLVQTEDSFLIPSPATSNLFMYGLCYVLYEVQCIHPYQRPIYVWFMLCSICSTVYPSLLATFIWLMLCFISVKCVVDRSKHNIFNFMHIYVDGLKTCIFQVLFDFNIYSPILCWA